MKKLLIIIVSLFLFGCEKSELPIEGHTMGQIEMNEISMNSNYSKQLYFNLTDNLVVKENLKTNWDLAFESSEQGWHILLNSSTLSRLSYLNNYNFEDIIDEDGLVWKWDDPRGIENGTALLEYPDTTVLYVVDRGFAVDGSQRGLKKMKIDSINNTSYFIRYSNLDNSDYHSISINKDPNVNFTYLSFDSNNTIDIEPPKEDWDLLFTQYTHLFEDNIETPAYLVTGVYSNYLNDVQVTKDSINNFEDINTTSITSSAFSNEQNAIGYKWKIYDFDAQIYSVNSQMTYIIKSVSNRYFKLRFLDFYNNEGEKGFPSFEIQEL